MSSLARFVRDLHETGRVVVPAAGPEADDPAALATALAMAAATARRAAPGNLPDPDPEALRWGFATLFTAARFLVHRDLGPEPLERAFADPGPAGRGPETVFAVDVGLRHLPTVAGWAKASAEDDPLVARLDLLGRAWPLSSVGMGGATGGDAGPLLAHPALLALYVDRIIAAGDAGRCADPRIRAAVAAALGGHRALAPPSLADPLADPESPT